MSFLMDLLFCKFTQDIYYRGVPVVLVFSSVIRMWRSLYSCLQLSFNIE